LNYYLLRRTLPIIAFFVFNYMETEDVEQIPVNLLAATFAVGYLILGLATRYICLLYTSPSPRDQRGSRMPSSA